MVIKLSVELMLTISLGIYARRRQIVADGFEQQLTALIMRVALPLMIIDCMQGDFTVERLKQCGHLLLLSLLMVALSLAIGQALFKLQGGGVRGRLWRFGAVFMNFTLVGIPVTQTLYGEEGVFFFTMFIVPLRLFYYSLPQFLLSPPGTRPERAGWKQRLAGCFSPPVAAVVAGGALFLLQIRLPAVLLEVAHNVGGICSPLGMLMCGLSIGKYELRNMFRPHALIIALVRNLGCPAAMFLLCGLLRTPVELARIAVICAALPIGVLVSTFVVQYDGSDQAKYESAGMVAVSSILSCVTIPLWARILESCYM